MSQQLLRPVMKHELIILFSKQYTCLSIWSLRVSLNNFLGIGYYFPGAYFHSWKGTYQSHGWQWNVSHLLTLILYYKMYTNKVTSRHGLGCKIITGVVQTFVLSITCMNSTFVVWEVSCWRCCLPWWGRRRHYCIHRTGPRCCGTGGHCGWAGGEGGAPTLIILNISIETFQGFQTVELKIVGPSIILSGLLVSINH